jgi:hypothetical protein
MRRARDEASVCACFELAPIERETRWGWRWMGDELAEAVKRGGGGGGEGKMKGG